MVFAASIGDQVREIISTEEVHTFLEIINERIE